MAFPENTPSVDDMLNMPVTELALMPPNLLAAVQAEIDVAIVRMKAVTERFALALEVRYAARAAECRQAGGGGGWGFCRWSRVLPHTNGGGCAARRTLARWRRSIDTIGCAPHTRVAGHTVA